MKYLNVIYLGELENYSNTLLLLGSVHGNETSGTQAIKKFINDIKKDGKKIKKGWRVICIPICNPLAYDKGVRYVKYDLNRIFGKGRKYVGEEGNYMEELKGYIKESDYILDLHSTHADDCPFGFQDVNTNFYTTLFENMSLPYIITGWEELYNEGSTIMGTIDYALALGKKGVTIECGSHYNKETVINAYKYLYEFLLHLHVCEEKISYPKGEVKQEVRMKEIVYKEKQGELCKSYKTFDFVKQGECIAKYNNGETHVMPYDGYIIMPNHNVKLGDEWFYLGINSFE